MLRAEGVTKRFVTRRGTVTPLDRVALQLELGERLGLTGPSGCGKSTLAAVLSLLVPPDAGTVSVDGQVVDAWGVRAPAALRRRVQLLWQAPRLAADPRMPLAELIAEPLVAAGQRLARRERRHVAAGWAERVGLAGELLDRHPHEVSEGQLQRACLARALILEPRYLLCDEPTSMLDVSTQAALLHTIAAAQAAAPLGVLLITHDTALAAHWCHHAHDLRAVSAR